LEELKELSTGRICETFIRLHPGLRSSKSVEWMPEQGKFWILNEIDGSDQELTEKQLFTDSNIGEALEKGALFLSEDSLSESIQKVCLS
jgi:hypothetical protein